MTNEDQRALSDDVKRAEGLCFKAYQDTRGVWTIGYGTNLQELVIDASTADLWLLRLLARAEVDARSTWPWFTELSGPRQAVFVELIYNMGLTRLRGFTRLLAAAGVGDWPTAAKELLDSAYAAQVPARAQRLAAQLQSGQRAVSA